MQRIIRLIRHIQITKNVKRTAHNTYYTHSPQTKILQINTCSQTHFNTF